MMKPDSIASSNAQECKRILVASDNIALVKHYASILGSGFELAFSADEKQAQALIRDDQPDLVLVDPAFNKGTVKDFVIALAASAPGIRIIVIGSETISQEEQTALLKAGVHGFCKRNTTPALLSKAIQLVSEGEFWLQRKLLAQLIGELAKEVQKSSSGKGAGQNDALKALTPRELEVARIVHQGNNNKTIARALDISERTVKAHLSAIFRKLNIENRLQLAIFFNKIT